jgi:hypothetical protein
MALDTVVFSQGNLSNFDMRHLAEYRLPFILDGNPNPDSMSGSSIAS